MSDSGWGCCLFSLDGSVIKRVFCWAKWKPASAAQGWKLKGKIGRQKGTKKSWCWNMHNSSTCTTGRKKVRFNWYMLHFCKISAGCTDVQRCVTGPVGQHWGWSAYVRGISVGLSIAQLERSPLCSCFGPQPQEQSVPRSEFLMAGTINMACLPLHVLRLSAPHIW